MQQDNEMLFNSMYEDYQATLRVVARSCNIPTSDIDDIIQETFIAYFSKYSLQWASKQKKAMLIRILKHKCIDYFRRNNRYESVSIDSEDFIDEVQLVSKHTLKDTLDHVIEQDLYRSVRQDIMELREDWKQMAMLYFVEERSIEEICELLDIPGTACRSRIYRVRKHLKQILSEKYF